MRFDVCAHTYDEHAGPQRFFAERVAQFIGASREEVIVELGAGTGALTRLLTGQMILATDSSLAMVERGRLLAPNANWSLLDAFNQAPPTASLQVSSGLLHWAEDPVDILSRWKRSLTPDGRMVHALPCEPCLTEWRALMPENPVKWRSQEDWVRLFEQAELKVSRWQSWTYPAHFESAMAMVRSFHLSGVTGRVQVGASRLRQAMRQYDAKHHNSKGVTATWCWLAIEAH